MNQWTDSAKARLEDYLARTRASFAASGADVDEVVEDLRRHVEEEAAARKLAVMTEQDVAQILARIGAADAPVAAPGPSMASPPAQTSAASRPRKPPGWTLLILGVLLPLGTIGFELVTGMCAGVLFEPFPTLFHILLGAFVPLANLAVWLMVRRGVGRWRGKLGFANGAAIGIASVYTLLLLPFTPFAAFAVIFYGLGLLPMGPLFALVAGILLRRHLRQVEGEQKRLAGLWTGLATGVAALVLSALPMVLTEAGLRMAASDTPAESVRGVRLLRACGQNEELLRACYGHSGRLGSMYDWGTPVGAEAARAIYYRVTGQAFNAVPPPSLYAGRGRWALMEDEFTWDSDQAGDAVAGRVKGLSLRSSRMDGVVEPDAALAYVEWTLELKNDSTVQREARAQLALPPGAVVSRVTLWVDGEEREAAFGGRSQVKGAYKKVVEARRDPVMVTTCGPDRVLVQCFPVPPGGGVMKFRLGLTTPLVLTNAETGFLRWPCFLERNFTIREDFRHSLWLDSSQALESMGGKLAPEQGKPGYYAIRGQVRDGELSAPQATVRVHRHAEVVQVWTPDSRGEDGEMLVRQSLGKTTVEPPDRVVMVIDGAAGMQEFYPAIAEALARLPQGIGFSLLLAKDGVEELSAPIPKGDAAAYQRAAHSLRKSRGAGGQDNVPALIRAWDLAAQGKAGAVVWIHGPQPMLFDSAEELRQRFERRPGSPLLLEVQTRVGPNRVAEKLDGLKGIQSAARLGGLGDDLAHLFGSWSGQTAAIELSRERTKAAAPGAGSQEQQASAHLVRLWAAGEISRLCEARKTTEAMQLAGLYQLVTPVSGAVVLETKAQYQQAGLQPAPAESVPVVPEPSSGLLCLVGLVIFGGVSRRHRRQKMRSGQPRRDGSVRLIDK